MSKQRPKKVQSKPDVKNEPIMVPQVFAKNYYIRGFGNVKEGDVVTKEIMDCWNRLTDLKPATNTK